MPSLDQANATFWNELCGSHLARILGITDAGAQSLAKYDAWYFGYYPYIPGKLRPRELRGKRVLEVGLGYGSLGQLLAESGADYLGLDISPGPVAMMRHRLAQAGLAGDARQCAFPASGLPDASFDAVVSIGCFHHTGATAGCIAETLRLLRPGGLAFLMVYNRHSYRQFAEHPWRTALSAARGLLGADPAPSAENEDFLRRYDASEDGRPAPCTEFFSRGQARRMLRGFSSVAIWKENCADERILGRWFKRDTLRPILGPLAGTDLYIRAIK